MIKYTREKLVKAVEYLEVLHFKPENIMVTGSVALDLLGVAPIGRLPHDVDFIIKMDDQEWRALKLIEAIGLSEKELQQMEKYPKESRKNMILLKIDKLPINIWRYREELQTDWSDIKDAETGVYVAKMYNILKAKKMIGRVKDYQAISEIAMNVINPFTYEV